MQLVWIQLETKEQGLASFKYVWVLKKMFMKNLTLETKFSF